MCQLFADSREFGEGFIHFVSASIHQPIEQGTSLCLRHPVHPSRQCFAMGVLAKVGAEPSGKRLRIYLHLYAGRALFNGYGLNDLSRRSNQLVCFIRRFADYGNPPGLTGWAPGTLRITQPSITNPPPYKVKEILIHVET